MWKAIFSFSNAMETFEKFFTELTFSKTKASEKQNFNSSIISKLISSIVNMTNLILHGTWQYYFLTALTIYFGFIIILN